MMNRYGSHGWGMVWWWIIAIGIVAAIVWIVTKRLNKSSTNQGMSKSALEILKERYARGEIDKQEFEERKRDLT
jgi:putative membrane protein|tara:strand:- start:8199 stop:8420 length:222 start_codon:yes stop_codon:yes gene_type:complete